MLRRLLKSFRDERKQIAVLTVFGVVTAGAEAGALVALAPLFQAVAEGSNSYTGDLGPVNVDLTVSQLSALAALLVAMGFLLSLLTNYVSSRIVNSYLLRRRLEFVRTFVAADWETQSAARDGRLVAFVMDLTGQTAQGLKGLSSLVINAAGLAVFLGVALFVSTAATLVIAITSSLIFLLQRPLRQAARRLSDESARCNVALSEELATISYGARDISAFGVGSEASSKFRQVAQYQRGVRVRGDSINSSISPLFRTLGTLMIIALIAYVGANGGIEVAALGVVVLTLYRSLSYGQALVGTHSGLVSLEPVLDQLEREYQSYRSHPRRLGLCDSSEAKTLELKDVCYRYPGSSSQVLIAVSFAVRRGEIVGIVGPSGAGKSTLADLIVGLREPTNGAIFLDAQVLTNVFYSTRVQRISLVSQAVPIIPATVSDNVNFFRELGAENTAEAITAVGLRPLIDSFPDGPLTRIGTGARALSGGQAQRLGIARAIAGKPDFLVLDEPTSALDPGSEEFVTDMIGSLRGRVGVIVIAHRLSTLRHCDRVIVMEDGQVTGDDSLHHLRNTNVYVERAFELGSLDWSTTNDELQGM